MEYRLVFFNWNYLSPHLSRNDDEQRNRNENEQEGFIHLLKYCRCLFEFFMKIIIPALSTSRFVFHYLVCVQVDVHVNLYCFPCISNFSKFACLPLVLGLVGNTVKLVLFVALFACLFGCLFIHMSIFPWFIVVQ